MPKVNTRLLIYCVRISIGLVILGSAFAAKKAIDSISTIDQFNETTHQIAKISDAENDLLTLEKFVSQEDAGSLSQRDTLVSLIRTSANNLALVSSGDTLVSSKIVADLKLTASLLDKPTTSYLLATSKFEQATLMLTEASEQFSKHIKTTKRELINTQKRYSSELKSSSRTTFTLIIISILIILLGVYAPSVLLRVNWETNLNQIKDQRLELINDYRETHAELINTQDKLEANQTQNNLLIQSLVEKDREIQTRLRSVNDHFILYSNLTHSPSKMIQQRLPQLMRAKSLADIDITQLHGLQSELWMLDRGIELVKKITKTIKLGLISEESNTSLAIGEAVSLVDKRESINLEIRGVENISTDFNALVFVLVELLNNVVNHRQGYKSNVLVEIEKSISSLKVSVSDDGPGVDNELYSQLTEPFYSTSKRAGLGLTAVAILMGYYEGELDFSSSEMGGLKVSFHWPIQ